LKTIQKTVKNKVNRNSSKKNLELKSNNQNKIASENKSLLESLHILKKENTNSMEEYKNHQDELNKLKVS
jgi:hypothetical protein